MNTGKYTHINTPARVAGVKRARAARAANLARYCAQDYHARRVLTHMYCNFCGKRIGAQAVKTRRIDGRLKVIRKTKGETPARQAGYAQAKATRAARIALECTPEAHARRALSHMYCGLCRRRVGARRVV